MRARNLKPGYFKSDQLAACGPWARLLFAGLWGLADREGRLENRPMKIKAEVFPFDSVDVAPLLDELSVHELILVYKVANKGFISIPAFKAHQNPHKREPESIIPAPPSPRRIKAESSKGTDEPSKYRAESGQDTDKAEPKPEPAGLNPESVSPLPESEDSSPTANVDKPVEGSEGGESERGEPARSKANPYCEAFEAEHRLHYTARYQRKRGDFVKLAECLEAQGGIDLDEWRRACGNYFATLQSSHTLADLAMRYPTFHEHALNEFGRPALPVGKSKTLAHNLGVRERFIERHNAEKRTN